MESLNHIGSSRMGQIKQIHFVGIGGAGMCGIAEVLFQNGYHITGSDLIESRAIHHLQTLGIKIDIGHESAHVEGADVVVRSSAIEANNPEIVTAQHKGIPVIPRAAMLAEIMRFRYGIAIAGTHGKTTTTSLVSSLLTEGSLDPSYIIGGKLNSSGKNAQLGKSHYLVAEADESDASFLYLKPMMVVVTNIDADHMGTYDNNFDKLRQTFIEFLHQLPFYGQAIVCLEDEEIRRILPTIERPTLTYGFQEDAQYRALNWTQNGLLSEFIVQRPHPHQALLIKFQWPGRHNVLNALASIVVATELGVDDHSIVQGLYQFQGVGRRFQILGERAFQNGSAIIVDDYGHHPKEILSTLETFRQVWPDKRLIHIFQPHRYTRTQALFDQFVDALELADQLLLLDIYSAGEQAIPDVSSQALLKRICLKCPNARLVTEENLIQTMDELIRNNDVILMQGAGNIGQLAANLMQPPLRETA